MSQPQRFVIAAGGTGGHLFPGLAVGEVLLARGHEVMILISEKEIDALATQGRTEFRIARLPGIGGRSAERIAFHLWLQWLADGQLAAAAASARSSGVPIGLYRDLAVGADRGAAVTGSSSSARYR